MRTVALLVAGALAAGCGTTRSTYGRQNVMPGELVWGYDDGFQVSAGGKLVASAGSWGGLSRHVSCSTEARGWAERAASRDRTGKVLLWTGLIVLVGGAVAGSTIALTNTDDTGKMLTGLGVVGGSLVVGGVMAPTGAVMRAQAETQAIDAVNLHNDELWAGRCR